MDSRDGNKDAATELRELAKECLKAGDFEGTLRRLSKSQRLYPCAETAELITEVAARMSNQECRNGGDRANGMDEGSDGGSSSSGKFSRDSSGSATQPDAGVRQRRQAAGMPTSESKSSTSESESSATQEQVVLVRRILKSSSSFYEVLELTKSCTEDEVKKSYRRLSLKVHPDKNKAPGAEEAFKVVSRAFKCLSDPRLRANYDNYGHEDPNQSRLQQQQSQRRHHSGDHPFAGHPFFQEDIDPNDIFTTFFNMHARNGRVFANRGGFPSQRRNNTAPRRNNDEGVMPFFALIQLIPFLMLLFFFLSPGAEPSFKIYNVAPYSVEMRTTKYKVPFYVKSTEEFNKEHPLGTASRWRVEQNVEGEYESRLETNCYQERIQKAQIYRWGSPAQAKKMAMPNCEELKRMRGLA